MEIYHACFWQSDTSWNGIYDGRAKDVCYVSKNEWHTSHAVSPQYITIALQAWCIRQATLPLKIWYFSFVQQKANKQKQKQKNKKHDVHIRFQFSFWCSWTQQSCVLAISHNIVFILFTIHILISRCLQLNPSASTTPPVCALVSCVQKMVWRPMHRIFNVRTDVDAYDCKQGL